MGSSKDVVIYNDVDIYKVTEGLGQDDSTSAGTQTHGPVHNVSQTSCDG